MTPGSLPKQLEARIAALPRNRHGRRTAAALIRLYVAGLNSNRVRYAAEKASRRNARKTPRERVADQQYAAFVKLQNEP